MKHYKDNNSVTVYSTEHGKYCPSCNKPFKKCNCKATAPVRKSDGIVRISRQTKGRKGKGVTLIDGIPLTDAPLKSLAKELKQKCGTGGTVKNGSIEIQGDHRDLLMDELKNRGYTVKKSGG